MKSKVLIVLIAILLAGGGVGAYLLTKDDSSESASNQTATSNEQEKKQTDSTPVFNPLATDDVSFKATMEVTSANEAENFNGTIERAKNGDIYFNGTQAGEAVEFYVTTSGRYVFCQAGQCYQLADGNTPISNDDVTESDEEIAKYKETAVYKGTEACIAGTCDVWEYTDEENEKVTVYVSKNDNRVVEMRSTDNEGADFKITYEYVDVTVTLPENVQELPGGI